MSQGLFNLLYHNNLLERIFHTSVYCLKRELSDCTSVLDLGCGPSSPLQFCPSVQRSVGVEMFTPYLEKSRAKGIHTEYLQQPIESLEFPPDSFDAVILIEVIEHMPEELGREMLRRARRWARKKVILTTPNGYFPMGAVDGNEYQRHLSGWTIPMLKAEGFRCRGLVGLKFFYHRENAVHSLDNKDAVFSNIRFSPKKLFYALNTLCQMVSYYYPRFSFGLLAVSETKEPAP